MNRKQFLTLIVIGLIAGALGIYFAQRQRQSFTSSSFQEGQKVIKDFPLNEVAQIRIQQGTNEVNLVRGDVWTVKERWDYPANFTEISGFLQKVWELKPVQSVEAGPSQYARLELATNNAGTNSGTVVDFKDGKGAALNSIILGKKYLKDSPGGGPMGGGGFPVGRYVLAPSAGQVWVVNETFENIEPKPEQWLNKDFFKVEKLKSVSVTSPNPTNTWSLARETETGEWKMTGLKEGEKFEASKASSLNYALSSPSFNDVLSPEAKPEETGLANATVARLETFEGFLYTLNIGTKTNEENVSLKVDVEANFPKERTPGQDEKPEDKEKLDKEFKEKTEKLEQKLKNEQRFEKWTYLVSKWTVDTLLKPRTDFMAAPESPSAAENSPAPAGADDGHDHEKNEVVPPFETVPKLDVPPPPTPAVPDEE